MALQMLQCSFHVVDLERAADAAILLAGRQHEVLDDELAAALEQFGERPLAVRRVEDVSLFDFDPRQVAAFGAEPVALPGQFFFLGEQRLACLDPFVA
jgi:hypothetical protein